MRLLSDMHVRPVKADITPCLKPIPLIILVKEEEPLHRMGVGVHVHHNKTIFSIEDADFFSGQRKLEN
jgi:hypothetical protein